MEVAPDPAPKPNQTKLPLEERVLEWLVAYMPATVIHILGFILFVGHEIPVHKVFLVKYYNKFVLFGFGLPFQGGLSPLSDISIMAEWQFFIFSPGLYSGFVIGLFHVRKWQESIRGLYPALIILPLPCLLLFFSPLMLMAPTYFFMGWCTFFPYSIIGALFGWSVHLHWRNRWRPRLESLFGKKVITRAG